MEEKRKKGFGEIDMCNGNIFLKMMLFTLPLIASGILQLMFNAADIIVVGKYAGDNSMAAVGATSSLINLITNIFVGLSVGVNVLTARYYGAKQSDPLSRTIHTAMLLGLFSGILLVFIGVFGAPRILVLMDTPGEVINLAALYLRIYFLGMPAMMVYNFGSAILRSVGDTARPMFFLLIAGVLNVILNLIFVIVFSMDVAGVALATILSQYLSAGLVVSCLIFNKGELRLSLKKLKIDWPILGKILWIGIPAGVQGVCFSLSNVFIQSSVNSFGAITVAGNTAAQNLEGFVYVAMNSFHQATISFTGQNMGAGKFDRIKKILFYGEISVLLVGEGLGIFMVLMGPILLRIYSDNPVVIQAGIDRLRIICSIYALCGMMDVAVGSIRGMGYSIVPTIVSLMGACVFRIVWLRTIFQMPQFHTIGTVYMSYPISWSLTLLTHLICFFIMFRMKYRAYQMRQSK